LREENKRPKARRLHHCATVVAVTVRQASLEYGNIALRSSSTARGLRIPLACDADKRGRHFLVAELSGGAFANTDCGLRAVAIEGYKYEQAEWERNISKRKELRRWQHHADFSCCGGFRRTAQVRHGV
jgi:hypothetical protein